MTSLKIQMALPSCGFFLPGRAGAVSLSECGVGRRRRNGRLGCLVEMMWGEPCGSRTRPRCEKGGRRFGGEGDAAHECSIGSSGSRDSSLRFSTQDFSGGRTMSLKRKVP